MHLSETDYRYIRLARFAADTGTSFADAIRLAKLAAVRNNAEATAISVDDGGKARKRADAALKRFEKFAAECGFGVMWQGLWPVLTRGGE